METLVSKENFKIVKVSGFLVKKTNAFDVRLSGFAILDKRVDKFVNLNDEYFTSFKTKKSANMAISGGLFKGFKHFNAA